MNEKTEKLGELLQNESLVAALKGKNVEDTLAVLKKNGLEFTSDELKSALDCIVEMTEEKELTLEEAENVAGGRLTLKEWWRGVKKVAKGFRDELFGW